MQLSVITLLFLHCMCVLAYVSLQLHLVAGNDLIVGLVGLGRSAGEITTLDNLDEQFATTFRHRFHCFNPI